MHENSSGTNLKKFRLLTRYGTLDIAGPLLHASICRLHERFTSISLQLAHAEKWLDDGIVPSNIYKALSKNIFMKHNVRRVFTAVYTQLLYASADVQRVVRHKI